MHAFPVCYPHEYANHASLLPPGKRNMNISVLKNEACVYIPTAASLWGHGGGDSCVINIMGLLV